LSRVLFFWFTFGDIGAWGHCTQSGLEGASLFTTVLTFDNHQAEDEDHSLPPHLESGGLFQSKLPPGILPHGLPQVKEVLPAITAVEAEAAKHEHEKEGKKLICTTFF